MTGSVDSERKCRGGAEAHHRGRRAPSESFLIDLIVELLGLIIKPFDNQTES